MAREQIPDIEQTVRSVLSDVLSEVSEEIGSSEPNGGGNGADGGASGGMGLRMRGARPGTPKPPGGEPGTPGLPSEVLEAVEDLYSDLSADQASALAQLFEAIANQAEEEGPGEPEDKEEGFGARAADSTCNPAYLWAKAEQHSQKADDYDAAARREAARPHPSAKKIAHYKWRAFAHQKKAERYRLKTKQCEA